MPLLTMRAAQALLCLIFLVGDQAPVWTASLRGVGPIRIGMRVSTAVAALGGRPASGGDATSECDYVDLASAPKQLSFMTSFGRIARYEVDAPGIKTVSGAEVGMSEDSVVHIYAGHIRTVPDPYSGPEWHNLIYEPAPQDSQYGLVFETDGHKVLKYRAGKRPHVEYIEGCS